MSNASPPVRGLRFALLAPPSVQAVRFGTKAALAWFLVPEDYGQAALGGLIAYLAAHVALLGLSEALVQAHELGEELWRRLRRLHHVSGIVMSVLMALLGLALGEWTADPLLRSVVIATAPMVWLANLATLPVALLIRRQEYARLFRIDVVAALALATVTVGLAAAGAGAWSVVAGFYANAIVTVIEAHRLARPFRPAPGESDSYPETLRHGRHFCAAELLSFGSEQVDSFGVGLAIGRAALGLYNYALTIGQVAMMYTMSVAERSLFPILAERRRLGGPGEFGAAYSECLRLTLLLLLPWHVVLAAAATPLTDAVFPERWAGIAPLLVLLSLASGARCIDLVASTGLKAAGASPAVARLGVARLIVLTLAVSAALPFGTVAVAAAALVSRIAAATATAAVAARRIRPAPNPALGSAVRAVGAWALLFTGVALGLDRGLGVAGPALLVSLCLLAPALWIGLRWLLDRPAFAREWRLVVERAGRGRGPGAP